MSKRPSLAESMKALARPAPSPPRAPRAKAAPKPAAGEAKRKLYHAATREGLKKVTAALEPAQHKKLKRLSVDQEKSVEDLLREAVQDLFAKYA
jgi:hypothetical protein